MHINSVKMYHSFKPVPVPTPFPFQFPDSSSQETRRANADQYNLVTIFTVFLSSHFPFKINPANIWASSYHFATEWLNKF